ncbi:hypothetical protein [Candidatus Lokiarchaeum ossiferum]|uniref:hypothetical protein n=1 Tax=Candidatus Lokiarchaeum ossiferum TaxID=2951803 RepID=UPI00352FE7B5
MQDVSLIHKKKEGDLSFYDFLICSQIGLEQTIGQLHESLPVGSPKYHQARTV